MNKNVIIRYSIFAGLWGLLLIPFFVANTMFFPYISGKNFAFRIIIEIIFALWVYLAFVDVKYRPKFSWIVASVTSFIIIMAFATLFAVNPSKAFWSNYERMDGFITLIHLLMYLLVFGSMMKTENIWLWFFRSSLITGAIMMISVFKEVGPVRATVSFGNPIYLGIYFLFNFFFALILLYKDVLVKKLNSLKGIFSYWLTYLYGFSLYLSILGVWKSGTRGVLLGLIGGLTVTAFIIAIFDRENKGLRRIAIGGLLSILLIIGSFISMRDSSFVQGNFMLKRLADISWTNIQGQGQARQYVWPMAIEGFKEKPILGWGQEGFSHVFNKYYDPRMHSQEQWFDRAHNTPLDILIAGGLLGLLTYLSIFLAAIYLIWKKRKVLGITDAAILIGLLLAYFAQNLFVFDNLISYILFITVLAYVHSRDTETDNIEIAKKQSIGMSSDMANYVVAPIILVTLGVSLWFLNVVPIKANTELIYSMRVISQNPEQSLEHLKKVISYDSFANPEAREQLFNIAPNIVASDKVDSTIKQNFADFAYDQTQEQLKQTPYDARYQFFTGVFLNNMSQYAMAIPYLEEAIKLSPKKQTMMFELGKAYAYMGEKQKVLDIAKYAYDLEPSYDSAKLNYIAAAIINDREDIVSEYFPKNATTTSETIVRAYLIRATELLKTGNKTEAILQVREAMRVAPLFQEQGQSLINGILDGTIK